MKTIHHVTRCEIYSTDDHCRQYVTFRNENDDCDTCSTLLPTSLALWQYYERYELLISNIAFQGKGFGINLLESNTTSTLKDEYIQSATFLPKQCGQSQPVHHGEWGPQTVHG